MLASPGLYQESPDGTATGPSVAAATANKEARRVHNAFSKPEPLRAGTSRAPFGCGFAEPRSLRAEHCLAANPVSI